MRPAREIMAALLIGVAMLGLVACHTTASGPLRPATLQDGGPATVEALTRALSAVLGEGRVRLGPSDLTSDPQVTLLPPPPGPYEGNSTAMPRYFDLMIDGKGCYARERKTGALHPLPGVSCRAK